AAVSAGKASESRRLRLRTFLAASLGLFVASASTVAHSQSPSATSSNPNAPANAITSGAAYVSPPKRTVPKPPAPTPEQVRALEMLQAEAAEYERAAKEHRDVITRIVRQHYEDRRRRLLASLDMEVELERNALREAREEAIKRLEEFVALYSGSNAHLESTPDAMFRLA